MPQTIAPSQSRKYTGADEGTATALVGANVELADHGDSRIKCRSRSRSTGERYGNWAINGLPVCRFHGGGTKQSKRAAERRLTLAQIGSALGIPKDVDPADALLDAVRLAAGDTEYLRVQVQALESGPVTVTPYGDGVHPFVRLYHDSLKRQGEMASMAIKAGVEERRVRLAESASVRLAQIIVAELDSHELSLAAQQRSAGRELAHRLMTNGPTVAVIDALPAHNTTVWCAIRTRPAGGRRQTRRRKS